MKTKEFFEELVKKLPDGTVNDVDLMMKIDGKAVIVKKVMGGVADLTIIENATISG